MKILQVIQKSQLRGAEVFACQLSNNLRLLGHDVRIVCLFEGHQQLPFDGPVIQLNRPVTRRLLDLKGWKQLADVIDEFQPDVVQANAGDTLKVAVLSKVFFQWHTPVIFRNASVIGLYLKSPLKKWVNGLLFRQVRYVISVTEASMRNFVEIFPFVRNRISVVPIGIECPPTRPAARSPVLYILHVGGFTFEKNHARLLEMFSDIKRHYSSLELWLVGDGPLRTKAKAQVEQMKLKHVRFLGNRNDVAELMQGASILVLPSIIEGLPAVILEAMYFKVPVVAYDVGGVREVLQTGRTGWLINANDEKSFVNTVVQVLSQTNELITRNAHEMVLRDFDNRLIAQKFVDIYNKVVAS